MKFIPQPIKSTNDMIGIMRVVYDSDFFSDILAEIL